ncbi:MAG: hypothetical protein BGO12_04435 [Verrucomicrobia bacterium 61-8]|nr:MAG: hypothetical protein BGO12_04435 [Verrucomicrobia bacterium 61-8]
MPILSTELPAEDSLPKCLQERLIPFSKDRSQSLVAVATVYLSFLAASLRGSYRLSSPGRKPTAIGFNVLPVAADSSREISWVNELAALLYAGMGIRTELDEATQGMQPTPELIGLAQRALHPFRNTLSPSLLVSELWRRGWSHMYYLRHDLSTADEARSLQPFQLQGTARILHCSWSGEQLRHNHIDHLIDLTGCFAARRSDAAFVHSSLSALSLPAPIVCVRDSVNASKPAPFPGESGFALRGILDHAPFPKDFTQDEKTEKRISEITNAIDVRIKELNRPLGPFFNFAPGLVRRISFLFTILSGVFDGQEAGGEKSLDLAVAFVAHLIREHLACLCEISALPSAYTSDGSENAEEFLQSQKLLAKIQAKYPISVGKLRKMASKNQRSRFDQRLAILVYKGQVHIDHRGILRIPDPDGF